MARTANKLLRARSDALLKLIYERTDPLTGAFSVSIANLSRYLDASESQVRYSLGSLRKEGMIEVVPQALSNGGQLENAYALTGQGRALVRRMRGGKAIGSGEPASPAARRCAAEDR